MKKRSDFIFVYILIIIILILIVNYKLKKDNLYENYNISYAIIYEGSTSKGGANLNYCFKIEKKNYIGNAKFGGAYSKIYKKFINKIFLVAYQKDDPKNNELILLKTDFEKYGLKYQDSLMWIQKYHDDWL